jgi:hypothetical protein
VIAFCTTSIYKAYDVELYAAVTYSLVGDHPFHHKTNNFSLSRPEH